MKLLQYILFQKYIIIVALKTGTVPIVLSFPAIMLTTHSCKYVMYWCKQKSQNNINNATTALLKIHWLQNNAT